MRIVAVILTILFFCSAGYADDAKKELAIVNGQSTTVLTQKDFRSLHVDSLEVHDPVYGKTKHYAGYWLRDVLGLAGTHPDPKTVWTFKALDGYKVSVNVADVIHYGVQGFVAVRDMDASEDWVKIKQGKQMISPGPFYLVWDTTGAPADLKLPWPYEMVEISIGKSMNDDQKVFPDDAARSPAASRGYELFKMNCISCHSINLQGGGLGPELNVPQNITEYENPLFLKAFIADPSSFRAQSKMPAFKSTLTGAQIDDVLAYLTWIGLHKKN